MIVHRIAHMLYPFLVPTYDASTTICTDAPGLVLAALIVLTGLKGGH